MTDHLHSLQEELSENQLEQAVGGLVPVGYDGMNCSERLTAKGLDEEPLDKAAGGTVKEIPVPDDYFKQSYNFL